MVKDPSSLSRGIWVGARRTNELGKAADRQQPFHKRQDGSGETGGRKWKNSIMTLFS